MSVEAMAEVFKYSPYKLGTRLVHLAIADVVNDSHDWLFWGGRNAIADKAKVTPRAVTTAFAQMVSDGYLSVTEERPGQPTIYRFLRPWVENISRVPVQDFPGGVEATSRGGGKIVQSDLLSTEVNSIESKARSAGEVLLRKWWERQWPRPTTNFRESCKTIDKLLKAGWAEAQLISALDKAPTISTRCLEIQLNGKNGTAPAPSKPEQARMAANAWRQKP